MGKNFIIAQSGGPTSVINASLAGAIKSAMASAEIGTVYGSLYGLEGILKNRIILAEDAFRSDEDFECLKRTPSMALGTCRFKLAKEPDENYEAIAQKLRDLDIGYFLYIGGNDSMDTVDKLSKYFEDSGMDIKCVGIPKTIDNDLVETDHTPGFGSAARYIAHSIREIYCDASVYDRTSVTILEIMGRNAGWLTASSVLARNDVISAPQLVFLPEVPFDREQFINDIKTLSQTEKVIVVAVSEGIKFASGEYVNVEPKSEHDSFGHAALSGSGRYLEEIIRKEFGFKTRNIEFSLLQRSAAHLASDVDLAEAERCGAKAVEYALAGMNRVMVSMKRISDDPYAIEYIPADVSKIANREKPVPKEWITPSGTDLTEDFIRYARPLIGENVLPVFFRFDKDKIIPPNAKNVGSPNDSNSSGTATCS